MFTDYDDDDLFDEEAFEALEDVDLESAFDEACKGKKKCGSKKKASKGKKSKFDDMEDGSEDDAESIGGESADEIVDEFDSMLEMDQTLSTVPGGSESDYAEDNGAGINASEKNTGFLKGMPDYDEKKYGHPSYNKPILSSVPDMFGSKDDPNASDMKLR